jgi:hypothetical protein
MCYVWESRPESWKLRAGISKKEVDHAAFERILHDGLGIHEVDLSYDN